MLKPSGRLVDLDWKDQQMDIGPPMEKRFSVEKARYLIEHVGFRIRSVQDAGPYHYLIIAIKDDQCFSEQISGSMRGPSK